MSPDRQNIGYTNRSSSRPANDRSSVEVEGARDKANYWRDSYDIFSRSAVEMLPLTQ
jgi:hypothetical protein